MAAKSANAAAVAAPKHRRAPPLGHDPMGRDGLIELYAVERRADRRAQVIGRHNLCDKPIMVGVLSHHAPEEVAAVCLSMIRSRQSKIPRAVRVAIVVNRGYVFLEHPSTADNQKIAMVANACADAESIAEAIAAMIEESRH